VQQPPQPVFLNTGPSPTGTQTRKGVLNKFMRGAMRSCHAWVDPETRRLNATSRLRKSRVQLWSRGHDASTKSVHISFGPKSSSLKPDPGQTDREGCEECNGVGSERAVSFRAASRDRRLELPSSPQDGNESLRGGSPRFPPTHPEDFHVKFILKTRPRSKPTVGGGAAAVAAAQPRSSPRRRSGRSELHVAPRNRAYEYEYCHTLRQRCAIPLVGSQPA